MQQLLLRNALFLHTGLSLKAPSPREYELHAMLRDALGCARSLTGSGRRLVSHLTIAKRDDPGRPCSQTGDSPEGAGDADSAKVVGGGAWFAADVAALEASRVPAGGETPQRRQVHHLAALVAGGCEPGVDAVGGAEDPLVGAGEYDVVPHVR